MWHDIIADVIDSQFVCVAKISGDEIIGFAAAGPESSGEYPYEGELYAIYLFQDWQSRGIGQNLVMAVANRLSEAGVNSMMV